MSVIAPATFFSIYNKATKDIDGKPTTIDGAYNTDLSLTVLMMQVWAKKVLPSTLHMELRYAVALAEFVRPPALGLWTDRHHSFCGSHR